MSHRKHHRRDKNHIKPEKLKEIRKKKAHSHHKRKMVDVHINKENEREGKFQLLASKVITECTSKLVTERKKQGFIAVKLPVVITEVMVDINIQNTIQFTRNVINLISIKRKVVLKQYKLIAEVNKLFFNGVVIKSIEYSEEAVHRHSNLNGRIKNITINIPFQCVTSVEYINEPQISKNKKEEPKVFKMINGEQTFVDSYREADEIYCELVKASFNELNINDCNNAVVGEEHINTFRKLKQKMVMKLTVRLLQNQIVFIKKD